MELGRLKKMIDLYTIKRLLHQTLQNGEIGERELGKSAS